MGRKVQEMSIGREIEEKVEHIDARILMGSDNRVGKDNRTDEKRAEHVLEVKRETRNQNTRNQSPIGKHKHRIRPSEDENPRVEQLAQEQQSPRGNHEQHEESIAKLQSDSTRVEKVERAIG